MHAEQTETSGCYADFASKDDSIARNLDTLKAALRGAMKALKSPLERWERKEFESVRRDAITGIRRQLAALRGLPPAARRDLCRTPAS